jgi:catechol 2,3-dioxygenase-like lactoylglutathione lyase family enzyme
MGSANMLSSSAVIAFVATKDAEKARAFYEGVLKLRLTADEPYALVFDANGIMLRVVKVQEVTVAPYTVLGWAVTDIASAVREFEGRGVSFERYPGLPQDQLGICTFPGGSKVAWFKDPDGNTLSLSEWPK